MFSSLSPSLMRVCFIPEEENGNERMQWTEGMHKPTAESMQRVGWVGGRVGGSERIAFSLVEQSNHL